MQVHLRHSDATGRVCKHQKILKARIDAWFDETGSPSLSIDAKPKAILVVPIACPLTLYPNRIRGHGQLGITFHKYKAKSWDRAHKVLQINIESESHKEELLRLSEFISNALRRARSSSQSKCFSKVFAQPLRPSNVLNTVSPVRHARDGYSKVPNVQDCEELPPLSDEQMRVFDFVVNRKKSLFFTGSAGTGKSLLLKHIIRSLPKSSTAVTGLTGLSASLLGSGSTIHAFAGIGRGEGDKEVLLRYAMRPDTAFRWRQVTTLIIDEISMMDGEFFDTLEYIARNVRGNSKPFGGIQLVICGDFHQLPPVARHAQARKFCFEASSWASCVNFSVELKRVFRQSDLYFIDVLGEVRSGRISHVDLAEKLSMCYRPLQVDDGILPTRLLCTRADVDAINKSELDKLDGDSVWYHARDSGDTGILESSCPAQKSIQLKIGAQVMLTKNLSGNKGLVNGSRGVVVKISPSGLPYVRFVSETLSTSSEPVAIERVTWTNSIGGRVVAQRSQIPLSLAYAITVHKSQGMSLDKVEISLERAFEAGMAYVALSRAKTMEGLRLHGPIAPKSLEADPKVVKFYSMLQDLS